MKHAKTFALVIIGLIAIYFVIEYIIPYLTNFGLEQFGDRYWAKKWWLTGHFLAGMIALLIGPFQFIKSFRNRYLNIHRTMGKIYIIAIIIGSFCAFYMSLYVSPQINMSWSIALFFLAVPWLISALMAYRMVRLKRIPQHREWMIRSYVVTFGFVIFRILNDESDLMTQLMPEFTERGPTIVWLAWAIPLFFTEVILQWDKKK